MFYNRIQQLADTIVNYSTKVQKGDLVMINGKGFDTFDLAEAVQQKVLEAGGVPYLHIENDQALRKLLLNSTEDTFKALGDYQLQQMKQFQVYVGIRGTENVFELADVPKEQLDLYNKYIVGPVHINQRVKHTRWVVMRYPNPAMCQLAKTSQEAFGKFYYDVCCLDYSKMNDAVQPLKELMNKTDKVRITAPDTDLTFSIKDINSVPCVGDMNIPDGECFTAPVKDSLNGTIKFNAASVHEGVQYDHAFIRFENGKAVEIESGKNSEKLKKVLTQDEGASYIGEFALGFNPYILHPMLDTLFDEKIAGSLHMAFGQCYEETQNGNQSSLHWDMVLIQRPEYGGGEVYFDDVLIRKDGEFVLEELKGLNAENLVG